MSLNDQLADDMPLLLSDFGESITYTPKGGSPVTCLAIIDRNPDARLAEATEGLENQISITISTGDVAAVILDGDTVSLPPRYGLTPKTYTVRQIFLQDAGAWKLRVA